MNSTMNIVSTDIEFVKKFVENTDNIDQEVFYFYFNLNVKFLFLNFWENSF